MADSQAKLQHFFLTRFNLLLWQKDKEGTPVRTRKWLDHRFSLFEKYCLPSVKNQACQDFVWIVLFDSTTPERYKERIEKYQRECPQFVPVFVEPARGRFFSDIFREEIVKRQYSQRVVTTCLDNDDAVNVRFVEGLLQRASVAKDGTFFYYDKGYQYYADDRYIMQIHYPRNHFVSVVEKGDVGSVKGIFGYGRHYYIDTIEGAIVEHINTEPMWCEVVHDRNMLNDANFLIGTKMLQDSELLKRQFAIDETVKTGAGIYWYKFLPRYIKTFMKRAKHYVFGRQW